MNFSRASPMNKLLIFFTERREKLKITHFLFYRKERKT